MQGRKERRTAQSAHASSQQSTHTQKRGRSYLFTILLSLLAIIALLHFIAVTHSAYPTIASTTCNSLIRNTDYTTVITLQPKTQEMGAVQFTDELTGGQPSALLQVVDTVQHQLDVYVYGCSNQQNTPALTLLLKRQGLVQGTVTITQAHTLSISELDTSLSPQASALLQPLQQNVYQEYSWQHGAFVQTIFPALYPVTSRSEAEALQEQANNGQAQPWNDPLATAEQMSQDLFKWSANTVHGTLLDNDKETAHVQLVQTQSHLTVTVTLMRLVLQNSTGLWFVTGAQTQDITIEQSALRAPIASPMNIMGTIAPRVAYGSTSVALFDHTLTPLSVLNTAPLTIQANGTYSGTISYTNTAPDQTALLLIEALPPAHSKASGQLLLTNVLLG